MILYQRPVATLFAAMLVFALWAPTVSTPGAHAEPAARVLVAPELA